MANLRAVVTGASSGMGAATVRQLRDLEWDVVAVARREDRLRELAEETGCDYVVADMTSDDDVARMASEVTAGGPVHALVANAGAAFGQDEIRSADIDDWAKMLDINVLGTLRSVKALIPALIESGRGDIVIMSSTAGRIVYEGGGGYTAAKHGTAAIAETLRLELAGEPVRVIEIAPGMVATEEFSAKRLGSQEAADKVYAGVENPLTAEDCADAIVYALTRPHHFNVDLMVIRPIAQAAQHKVARNRGL
ncbi:SDR family NAD(P)-dependent oxidoreductase [Brevibacterium sp. 5221]|uniref:SDR family NAD(P)-dependent oxidoreductase n=1 Tax=Brevibacterium rongguiense TaxID=2695267 RepID=A0A6N9H9T4_9MICO|nr:SDR family oxidoreductase [Brevibacterium rongguiense]MYM20506.1 SDR family NAD(P)-dependent oxidoreductase [Brevibacterium rongguiense]